MYEPDKKALDWIESKSPCAEFRLKSSDFTIQNQDMIRELYRTKMLMIPKQTFYNLMLSDFNQRAINVNINRLKRLTRSFDQLFSASYKNFGPGEVLLYILVDNVKLAGTRSGDLQIGRKTIELKAARYQPTLKRYIDFRISKVNQTDLVLRMRKLAEEFEEGDAAENPDTIKTIEAIRLSPTTSRRFDIIEKQWQERLYNEYLKNQHLAVINQKTKEIDVYLDDLRDAKRFKIYRTISPGVFAPSIDA